MGWEELDDDDVSGGDAAEKKCEGGGGDAVDASGCKEVVPFEDFGPSSEKMAGGGVDEDDGDEGVQRTTAGRASPGRHTQSWLETKEEENYAKPEEYELRTQDVGASMEPPSTGPLGEIQMSLRALPGPAGQLQRAWARRGQNLSPSGSAFPKRARRAGSGGEEADLIRQIEDETDFQSPAWQAATSALDISDPMNGRFNTSAPRLRSLKATHNALCSAFACSELRHCQHKQG